MFSVYMRFHIDIIVKPAYNASVQIRRDFQNKIRVFTYFSV